MRFDELVYISSEIAMEQTTEGIDIIISCHKPGYICISWAVENVYRICYQFKSRCSQAFVFTTDAEEFSPFISENLTNATEFEIEIVGNEYLFFKSKYFEHHMQGHTLSQEQFIDRDIVHPSQFLSFFHSVIGGENWYHITSTAEIADINSWHPSQFKPNISLHFYKKWVTAIAITPHTVATRMLPTQYDAWESSSFTIASLSILKMDEIFQAIDHEGEITIKANTEFVLLECLKPNGTKVSITTPTVPGLIKYPQFHSTLDCKKIAVSSDKLLRCIKTLTLQGGREINILRENVELKLINSDKRLYLCPPRGELGLILCENDAPNGEIALEANNLEEIISTIHEETIYLAIPQKPGDPLLIGDNRGVHYTIFGYTSQELDLDADLVVDQVYNDHLLMSEKMFFSVSPRHARDLYNTAIKFRMDDGVEAKEYLQVVIALESYSYLCQKMKEMRSICHENIEEIYNEQLAQILDELLHVYKKNPYCLEDWIYALRASYAEYAHDGDNFIAFCFEMYKKANILLSRLEFSINGGQAPFALEMISF